MAEPEPPQDKPKIPASARPPLPPAAQRALAEAEERRREMDRQAANRPKETGRKAGPEPTRYGDWENKGIASDF